MEIENQEDLLLVVWKVGTLKNEWSIKNKIPPDKSEEIVVYASCTVKLYSPIYLSCESRN